ncbi:hypothetical protein N7536_000115 [Penicillium majusculum]|nr:hypothetical protein N7536_000115 [Penicillium majusculum]
MAPLAEHTSDSENDGTLGNIKDPRDELKGWRPDVCKMLPQGVKQSIMLLRNLGLIDEKDNKANGLEAISHRAEYTLNRRHWDFDLSRLMKEDPAILARELSDESSQKFRRIPYEEFARGLLGSLRSALMISFGTTSFSPTSSMPS